MKSLNLKNLKCVSCSGNNTKLTSEEINKYLGLLNNWNINVEGKMIFKKYIFKNFKKSLEFANSIGAIADEEGHHPDLSIGYTYCLVMIHTHAIKELSLNDFILASKIDLINI
jgi:4a-hydroxytetrahydrobiopterin dehydratase